MHISSAGVATSVLSRTPLLQHAVAWVGEGLDARAGGCGASGTNAVRVLRPALAALARANHPAGNQRCVSEQGVRRPGHLAGPARIQMRAPSARPARDSSGMGVGPHGRSRHGRRNMLCSIKCAVAAREARRRRDSPAAAPAARFTLTCAPWCVFCIVTCCLSLLVVCCMLSAAYRVMFTNCGPLSFARCMLHVVQSLLHLLSIVSCMLHVVCCRSQFCTFSVIRDPWSVALLHVGGCNVFCSVVCCMLRLVRCMLSVTSCPLHVVYCLVQRWRCLRRGVRCRLSVACCLLHVPCFPLHVASRPLWSVATAPVATPQRCTFAMAQGRACISSRCGRSSAQMRY
jgi:hypothetical protein